MKTTEPQPTEDTAAQAAAETAQPAEKVSLWQKFLALFGLGGD